MSEDARKTEEAKEPTHPGMHRVQVVIEAATKGVQSQEMAELMVNICLADLFANGADEGEEGWRIFDYGGITVGLRVPEMVEEFFRWKMGRSSE